MSVGDEILVEWHGKLVRGIITRINADEIEWVSIERAGK